MDQLKIPYKAEENATPYTIPQDFASKIKNAGMYFDFPSGFEPVAVRDNPDVKYDYAVKYPNTDFEIRYFIWPYDSVTTDSGKRATTPDEINMVSGSFVDFYTASLLNAKGARKKKELKSLEIKTFSDQDAKQKFKADKTYMCLTECKSDFSKGYKYCFILGLHKEKVGAAYIYMLSNDKKWFDSMQQIIPYTLVFE
jgi:hypothetical protein